MRFFAQVLIVFVASASWVAAQETLKFDLEFEGETALDEADLKKRAMRVLGDLERWDWLEASVGDAAYLIRADHVYAGYLEAQVEGSFLRDEEGVGVVRFEIKAGVRTGWEETDVSGVSYLDEERLAEFFDPTRTLVDRAMGSVRWYSESELNSLAGALRKFYLAEGFREATVDVVELRFDETREWVVPQIQVAEGTRQVVREIDVLGVPTDAEVDLERHRAELVDGPYTPRRVARFARQLEGELGADGWADASVVPEVAVGEDGSTRITATVEPNERVRVANLRFVGLEKTRESFARARIELAEGDWYDASEVRAAFTRLLATGLFESVDIALEGGGPRRDLVVTVVESMPIELFVEPGLGSYEGPRLVAGARHKNIFGTGRTLRAEGLISTRSLGFELGFTDPWWLGERTVTDVTVEYLERDEPSFDFEQLGLEATIRTDYGPRWDLAWAYRIRRTEIVDFDITDPFVLDLLEKVDVASLGVTPSYDSRDSVLLPRDGFRSSMTLEWANGAIGSDVDFVRMSASWSQYEELTEGTVVAWNLRSGWTRPTGNEVLPLQERFFNGGQNTVRSFRESELGPTDAGGEPVGGEAFHVASVELRQELTERFEGALFYDTGTVIEDAADWSSFDGFRSGVGVGLRYLLPIGPLRLDVGYNPDASAQEEDWVLHFALGTAY